VNYSLLLPYEIGDCNEIGDCTSREAHSCNRHHELRPGNKWSRRSLAMGIQRIVEEDIWQ